MAIFNAAPITGGGGAGLLISTPTTFSNYDSSKSAGYAEFPVDGMPTAFVIIASGQLTMSSSYNYLVHASYNIFEDGKFYTYYRTSSAYIKGTTSSNPSNYITYENGLLKVGLFAGIRFLGAAGEHRLIYSL